MSTGTPWARRRALAASAHPLKSSKSQEVNDQELSLRCTQHASCDQPSRMTETSHIPQVARDQSLSLQVAGATDQTNAHAAQLL